MRPLLALYRLALALLLLGPQIALGAIAVDGNASMPTAWAQHYAPFTFSKTISTNGPATLVLCYSKFSNAGVRPTVGGLSWTFVDEVYNVTTYAGAWIAYSATPLSGVTVTATCTNANDTSCSMALIALAGTSATPLGSHTYGASGAGHAGNPSSTAAASWMVACGSDRSTAESVGSSLPSGATVRASAYDGVGVSDTGVVLATNPVPTPGTAYWLTFSPPAVSEIVLEVLPAPPATAPTASPGAGTYTSAQSVTLSTTSGSVICYTTDGSTPATNGSTGCTTGTLYSSPVSVAANLTLKAIAGGSLPDSTVASFAYVINYAPTVTAVTPNHCTSRGACSVTITGTNFRSGASATFGGTACTGLSVVDAATITCTVPAHAVGHVDVTVSE